MGAERLHSNGFPGARSHEFGVPGLNKDVLNGERPLLGEGERGRKNRRRPGRSGAPRPAIPDTAQARLPQPQQPDVQVPAERKSGFRAWMIRKGIEGFRNFIEESFQKVGRTQSREGEIPYPEALLGKYDRESPLRPEDAKKPFFQRFWEKAGINYEAFIDRLFGDPVKISQGILNNPLERENTTRLQWEFISAAQASTKIPHAKHYALMHWSREAGFWIADKITSAALFIPFAEAGVDFYASHRDKKRGLVNEANFQRYLATVNFSTAFTILIPFAGIPINFTLDTLMQDRYFDPSIQRHNADVRELDMNAMNDAMLNNQSPFHQKRGEYAQVIAGLTNFGAGRKAIGRIFENRKKIDKVIAELAAEEIAIIAENETLRNQPPSKIWLFGLGKRINRAREGKIVQNDARLAEVRDTKTREISNLQYSHRLYQMVDYSESYFRKQAAHFEAEGKIVNAKRNRAIADKIKASKRPTFWTRLKDVPVITA